jgi:hypothetical protein
MVATGQKNTIIFMCIIDVKIPFICEQIYYTIPSTLLPNLLKPKVQYSSIEFLYHNLNDNCNLSKKKSQLYKTAQIRNLP